MGKKFGGLTNYTMQKALCCRKLKSLFPRLHIILVSLQRDSLQVFIMEKIQTLVIIQIT